MSEKLEALRGRVLKDELDTFDSSGWMNFGSEDFWEEEDGETVPGIFHPDTPEYVEAQREKVNRHLMDLIEQSRNPGEWEGCSVWDKRILAALGFTKEE